MLPTFLMLILLALQPVCLLYTRAVMESAAAETARLMTTTTAEDDDLKEFTRRDRKSTRLNSSHGDESRMPSSA